MRDRLTTQSRIILIVDDQPTNLKMLFSLLQESGYNVLVVKQGESAIKKRRKVSPDLILLNVTLSSGIDGFETCQRLKASPETKDIPIILITDRSDAMDKIKGFNLEAVDYITQPFQQEEVLVRIENQLNIRRLQKQLEEKNKQLQQEINTRRKLEERLELVSQAANDGFWDLNLDSGEIYISPRFKEMLGYSDEALPNELATWENHIFAEDRIAALKLVQDYNSGQASRFESIQRFHDKNGSTVHILVRALHLKDANGQVSRLIGSYTDITEITTTLEALRHSRRLLAGVLNSSLDGVAAFSALRDSQGNIIDFIWLLLNPAAEKITGRTESELVGKQLLVEMPGIMESGVFQQYVSVIETGEALEIEHYYPHKNIQAWFQVVAVKLGDGFAVTFRDITERKQMEARNRALVDAIPDFMFRQRVDGTYLDVRAKEDCSIVSADLISSNFCNIPLVEPEGVKQGIFRHLQSAVKTGKLQIYEYEIPLPDGVHTYESRCVRSGADEAIRIVRDVTEGKRSEAALRESEAQFRGIFENAAIGIGLTGADGTLLNANPTLEAFLGYSEAEMRGKDFANITYPDDRAADHTLTSEVINGIRDSFQIEKRYIRKDGQIFWGRLTVSAVRNLAGEFQFTVAILEDINDRKLRELALNESERRFRATFNDSFQFTALLEPDGTVIEANQRALDFGGVEPTEITRLPFWETCWWRGGEGVSGRKGEREIFSTQNQDKEQDFTPSFLVLSPKQERLREAIRQAASGQFVRYEVDVRGVGDSFITIDFSIKPVLDESGNVVLLLPEGRDITERKKAEERLRLLESAIVNANDAVIITEAEPIHFPGPRIIYVNEAFTRMTGYGKEDVIGQTPRILQGAKTDRTQLARIQQALQTWQSVRVELINYRKDGSEFWVELEIVPVADETGWFTHWVAVQRDITERKVAQEALLIATQRLEYLLCSSPSIIYCCQSTDPYGATFISENVTAVFGYEPQDFLEDESFWVSRIHPGDIDRVLAELPQLFEVGHHSHEYRLLHQDGTYRWVLDALKIVHDEAGNPIECIGSWLDITERKHAEERLRLLERAIAASGNAIVISDALAPDKPIIYVNSGFERMTGYPRDDVIGSQYCSYLQIGATPTALEDVRRALTEGRETQVTLRSSRIDGTLFWNQLCITPVRDVQGRLTHFIGVQTDISDRKQVEEALWFSEERLQLAIEGSAMGLWDWNISTGQVYFDPQWKTMLGYEVEEIENSFRSWEQLLHPEDLPFAIEAINTHFEGHTSIYEIEVRMLSKSGEWKWILSQGKVMERDVSGAAVRMTGTHIDISDRKQAQETLQQQKELLQTIFDHIPVMVTFFDANGRMQLLNREVERVLGWSLSHLEDVNILADWYPDSEYRQMVLDFMLAATGKWQDFKTRTRDGGYVDTSWANVRLSDGKTIGIGQDITERKIAEERLRLLERAIAASNNGIIISDAQAPNNPIIYVNSGFERMTGYRREEVLGSQCCSFEQTPCTVPIALEELQCTLTGGKATQVTLHSSRKDGTFFWSEFCITPVRDATGRLTHFIGVQTDISDRILAQESLRESEERFRTMADSTPVLLWVSGPDSQCTFINKTCLEFTGCTLEQELGFAWLDSVHPDDQQRCMETYLKSFEVRESFEMEYRLLRFDGEYRWIVELGKPRFTPNGSFAGYIGSCIDITERKQAEIEIMAAKAALEQQIQRVLLLERITQEIRSSLNSQQIFETAATQIGQAFRVNRCIIHTYVAKPFPRIPQVAEYTEPGYLSMMDIEIPVVGNSHAELVLSQDQAVASNDVYSDPLLEGLSDVMQHLELKSVLVVRTSYQGKANGIVCLEQCNRFRVWTAEEIELLEAVATQMGIAIAQANLLEQETKRRQELAAQNYALEKAKHEAEAANRAKSNFLSKMSHELRTPLNAILGFTQVMARGKSLTREQLEHLGIINRSGEHLLELINDILSMSKIEAGQITLNENRFDLYQLLDSLEEMLRLKATSKGLKLVFERTPDLPQYVQTDESKLRQVLINLLGNAIKFTLTGSVTLRVRGETRKLGMVSRQENHSTPYSLIFEVQDTGPGIAPEELETIFDPFVQTQTGRQSLEGTGLGLPISQQFVRMIGGNITVNTTLSQGAIFTFDIQVALVTSADEKPLSSQRQVISLEPNQPSYRILVVEDVLENRQLLVEMLEFVGFEVREATNGQEGVALWESWSPHLICMDIVLPIMDGYEATQQIKGTPKGKNTVIIALTASAFEEQREAILRAGCNDFLPKPFQQEVLLEKIAHHLGVRYVYGGQRSPTSNQSPAPEEPLTPQALAIMPTSWVTQLHQAALYADDELMNQLIEQIPREHDSLRRTLKQMLNNFRLEHLIDLTELAGPPEG